MQYGLWYPYGHCIHLPILITTGSKHVNQNWDANENCKLYNSALLDDSEKEALNIELLFMTIL